MLGVGPEGDVRGGFHDAVDLGKSIGDGFGQVVVVADPGHRDEVPVAGDRVDLADAVELGNLLGAFGNAVGNCLDRSEVSAAPAATEAASASTAEAAAASTAEAAEAAAAEDTSTAAASTAAAKYRINEDSTEYCAAQSVAAAITAPTAATEASASASASAEAPESIDVGLGLAGRLIGQH